MINFLGELPSDRLFGRALANTKFCDLSDISGKNILEIGCGFGWFCKFVLDNGACYVHGIDLNSSNISMLKKYFIDSSNAKFDCVKIEDANIEKKFDTIVAWEVLEHLPKNSEEFFFKNLYNLLKDGGVFYMSTPHSSFFSNLFDPAWFLSGHRHYTTKQLKQLANTTGFKIETYAVLGGWWEILYMLNLYIAKWVFRRRPFFIDKLQKHISIDFQKDGFTNIFIKFVK